MSLKASDVIKLGKNSLESIFPLFAIFVTDARGNVPHVVPRFGSVILSNFIVSDRRAS
jgi:hypothetical protein